MISSIKQTACKKINKKQLCNFTFIFNPFLIPCGILPLNAIFFFTCSYSVCNLKKLTILGLQDTLTDHLFPRLTSIPWTRTWGIRPGSHSWRSRAEESGHLTESHRASSAPCRTARSKAKWTAKASVSSLPWPRQTFPTQSTASNKAAGGWFSPALQRKRNRGKGKRQKRWGVRGREERTA